ncbi:MAG: hypothetical protein PHD82_10150, partial [Candidatus Riflebacteria bacterium]|nr:hypothetical protein [Candidatus Riflebacteria bacterium]
MNEKTATAGKTPAWLFPAWARAAGLIIFVFGLIDLSAFEPGIFMPLSLLLMFVGMRVSSKNLATAKTHGVIWLPLSFKLWGWLNVFALIGFRFMPGILRQSLIDYAIRAPSWLVFGAWLAWHAHKVEKTRRIEADVRELKTGNALALFRFGLLFMFFLIILTDVPMFSMHPAPGHTATFVPMQSEYMKELGNGASSGVLGLTRVQETLNA